MSKNKKIDPKRWYSLNEMYRENLLYWISSRDAYRRAITTDMLGENILKTKTFGIGNGKTYRIEGKNIIKYLVYIEDIKK